MLIGIGRGGLSVTKVLAGPSAHLFMTRLTYWLWCTLRGRWASAETWLGIFATKETSCWVSWGPDQRQMCPLHKGSRAGIATHVLLEPKQILSWEKEYLLVLGTSVSYTSPTKELYLQDIVGLAEVKWSSYTSVTKWNTYIWARMVPAGHCGTGRGQIAMIWGDRKWWRP